MQTTAHSMTSGGAQLAASRSGTAEVAPVLVFDGGCPFCRHFAELSELRGGVPDLQIRDGRSDHDLRLELARRGYHLGSGAMLLLDGEVLHGAEAIQWICARMRPSVRLLRLLAPLLGSCWRAG